jgi:transcriptional regulator with XRE-family HTH domain
METLHEFLAAKKVIDGTKSQVGTSIQGIRESVGLSQSRLAQLASLNQAYLSQVEKGTKTPSTDSLHRIVNVLNAHSADATAASSLLRTRAKISQRLTRKESVVAQLFEYAVLLEEKRDKDDDIVEESELIVPITTVLARDDAQAQMLAARAIPEVYVKNGKLDRLVVVVRPF